MILARSVFQAKWGKSEEVGTYPASARFGSVIQFRTGARSSRYELTADTP
jgi:hypothetical protein